MSAKRLAEIVVESADPAGIGRHWSAIIEKPFAPDGEGGRVAVDMTAIRFVKAREPRESLRTLVIEVADRTGIEKRAAQRGYSVADGGVEFCGVRFDLTR